MMRESGESRLRIETGLDTITIRHASNSAQIAILCKLTGLLYLFFIVLHSSHVSSTQLCKVALLLLTYLPTYYFNLLKIQISNVTIDSFYNKIILCVCFKNISF